MEKSEEKEPLKTNRLIAEFMGGKCESSLNTWKFPEETEPPFAFLDLSQFKYHTSWSWLMPVVEKIENLGYISIIEKMNTEFDCHRVFFNKRGTLEEVARGSRDESKFVAVHLAVEDFIKWFNKQ